MGQGLQGQRGTEDRGIPDGTILPETETKLRSLLMTPVPTGSSKRFNAIKTYFSREISPSEAARLHTRLSDPKDPLRQLMKARLTKSRVPELVDLLRQSSHGYSARTAPQNLDDEVLRENFQASSDRLAQLSTAPMTSKEMVFEESVAQELYEEQARRQIAYTPVPEERMEEIQREAEAFQLKQEREAMDREIREVAKEAGISEDDVRKIYAEYDAIEVRRRHPGVVDPGLVPFLNSPFAKYTKFFAQILSYFMPGVGLIEAYFGVDAQGNKLSTGERILAGALELIPLAGGLIGKIAGRSIKALAKLSAATGIHPRKMLPYLKRMSRLKEKTLKQIHTKVQNSLKTGQPLKLNDEELRALQSLDETIRSLDTGTARFSADPGGSIKPRQKRSGGKPRRKEEDVPDIVGDTAKASGQRLSRISAKKALELINRKVSSNKNVRAAWTRATNAVIKKFKQSGKTLDRSAMIGKGGLYDQSREQFWKEVWDNPQAKKFFEDAGYTFNKRGTAPLHKEFLDLPDGLHDEIRISLDHIDPKAGNWRKALDAKNLRFVHQADNRMIDLVRRYMPTFWQ